MDPTNLVVQDPLNGGEAILRMNPLLEPTERQNPVLASVDEEGEVRGAEPLLGERVWK